MRKRWEMATFATSECRHAWKNVYSRARAASRFSTTALIVIRFRAN
jgi:hypothetical protein